MLCFVHFFCQQRKKFTKFLVEVQVLQVREDLPFLLQQDLHIFFVKMRHDRKKEAKSRTASASEPSATTTTTDSAPTVTSTVSSASTTTTTPSQGGPSTSGASLGIPAGTEWKNCPYCDDSYTNDIFLKWHISQRHYEKVSGTSDLTQPKTSSPPTTRDPGPSTSSTTTAGSTSPPTTPGHGCRYCKESFPNEDDLNLHIFQQHSRMISSSSSSSNSSPGIPSASPAEATRSRSTQATPGSGRKRPIPEKSPRVPIAQKKPRKFPAVIPFAKNSEDEDNDDNDEDEESDEDEDNDSAEEHVASEKSDESAALKARRSRKERRAKFAPWKVNGCPLISYGNVIMTLPVSKEIGTLPPHSYTPLLI